MANDLRPQDWGCSPAWTRDGTQLAIAAKHQLFLFNAESGAQRAKWDLRPNAIGWSPDGTRLCASQGGTITHIDLASGELSTVNHASIAAHAAIHPSGRYVAQASYMDCVEFLALNTATPIVEWLAVGSNNSNMIIAPNGHWRGSAAMADQIVYVVETAEGQETLTPAQMTEKYGWVNDPTKAVIEWPEPAEESEKAAE